MGEDAHAEAALRQWCNLVVAPARGRTIPSNAPALVVMDRSDPGVSASFTVQPLVSAATTEVALSQTDDAVPGATLLPLPPAGLASDTLYTTRLRGTCSRGDTWIASDGDGDGDIAWELRTSAAVALPTAVGVVASVAADEPRKADVSIDLSPELAAYLPVTRFDVTLVAVESTTTPPPALHFAYGEKIVSNGALHFAVWEWALERKICGSATDGLRPFELRIDAHVAGATTDPAALQVTGTMNCAIPSDQTIGADRDAGPDEAANASTPDPEGDGAGGCRMVAGERDVEAASLCGTAMFLAFAGASRRRRRSRA